MSTTQPPYSLSDIPPEVLDWVGKPLKALTHTEIRFLTKTKVVKHTMCWEWTAYTNHDGYGVFRYKGKTELAHRVSIDLLTEDEMPEGRKIVVQHSCHNRPCVNPNHLHVGPQATNVQKSYDEGDKVPRTRGVYRSDGFDEPDIRRIRRLANDEGWLQREIADQYDITQSMVSMILSGEAYGYVE